MDYLSALPLAHLTGDYDYEDQDQATYVLYFDAPKEVTRNLCVVLSGRQCEMDPSNGRASSPTICRRVWIGRKLCGNTVSRLLPWPCGRTPSV